MKFFNLLLVGLVINFAIGIACYRVGQEHGAKAARRDLLLETDRILEVSLEGMERLERHQTLEDAKNSLLISFGSWKGAVEKQLKDLDGDGR